MTVSSYLFTRTGSKSPRSSLVSSYASRSFRLQVGKRHATSSRRRPVTPDPTPTLKCDLAGCSARFTTDESLTLHRQCHVGGGSGLKNKFRCVVCQVAFCYWWPLRLHLWREHDRLMDFACDFRTASARKVDSARSSVGSIPSFI